MEKCTYARLLAAIRGAFLALRRAGPPFRKHIRGKPFLPRSRPKEQLIVEWHVKPVPVASFAGKPIPTGDEGGRDQDRVQSPFDIVRYPRHTFAQNKESTPGWYQGLGGIPSPGLSLPRRWLHRIVRWLPDMASGHSSSSHSSDSALMLVGSSFRSFANPSHSRTEPWQARCTPRQAFDPIRRHVWLPAELQEKRRSEELRNKRPAQRSYRPTLYMRAQTPNLFQSLFGSSQLRVSLDRL